MKFPIEQIIRYTTDDGVHVKCEEVGDLVRCKDCIYSSPFDEEELKDPFRVGEWYCDFWCGEMHEDDYCSCGERSKDG